jgi:NAD-dependent DNA ligase
MTKSKPRRSPSRRTSSSRSERSDYAVVDEFRRIASSIIYDGQVTLREFQSLINWLLDHQTELSSRPLFDLKILISEILSDGRITDEEREGLVEFLERYSAKLSAPKKILKSRASAQAIDFDKRTFQFTGPNQWLSQRKAIRAIKERGGYFSTSSKLTPRTDYLVVGTLSPSPQRDPTANGKLRAALSMIQKGQTNVKVVTEADLVRSLLHQPKSDKPA